MKILIMGLLNFADFNICNLLLFQSSSLQLYGLDNFIEMVQNNNPSIN
jgi:hypothetical protein